MNIHELTTYNSICSLVCYHKTSWSKILLKKLIFAQLFTNSPHFMLLEDSLAHVKKSECTQFHRIPLISILILSSNLNIRFRRGILPSNFLLIFFSHVCYMPLQFHPLLSDCWTPHYAVFSRPLLLHVSQVQVKTVEWFRYTPCRRFGWEEV